MIAAEALVEVWRLLDDLNLVHASPEAGFRMINRAHQYVAVRFSLFRETQPVLIVPSMPLYRIETIFPRLVRLVSANFEGIIPLWLVPMDVIRFADPRWLDTQAVPGKPPQWIYPYGRAHVGLYPVPTIGSTMYLTGVVAPEGLIDINSALLVPEAYLPNVVQVTAGLLAIASERAHQHGLKYVTEGLGLKAAA